MKVISQENEMKSNLIDIVIILYKTGYPSHPLALIIMQSLIKLMILDCQFKYANKKFK